ncbi:MAG: PPC domain-containing protein [Anaerolineales bacterium]|jgi:hypothetical protein
MRTLRILSATLILLVACSCLDIPILQDLLPDSGDDDDQGDVVDDGDDQDDQIVPTQTPTPPQVDLSFGDTVSETLSSGRGDLWTFYGESGDVVTITMNSDVIDTFLALFDPSGSYLTCDDDGGDDFNASIIDFPLPDSGVYTIVAMGLTMDDLGMYSLSIAQTTNGLLHPPVGGGSLSIGETKTGSLANWTGDAWTFTGTAGNTISIGARSEAFDTVLAIYGPDLHREAYDDDGLGDLNSLVSGFTLPSSGRFTAVVRAFSSDEIGSYEIGTSSGTEIPGWEAVSPDIGADLFYGDTVVGNILGVEGEQWFFSGSAGDSVLITANSEAFDTFLALFGTSGEYLTCDDDSGTDYNARIDGYTLPNSGLYIINVISYSPESAGGYTLTLDTTSPSSVPSSSHSGEIDFGDTVSHTLVTWVGDEWLFYGNAGDVVTISLDSANFDTFLELYDPLLTRIAIDDDSGGDLNSEIADIVLPETGIYTIITRSFSDGETGSYSLSLTH